ncbi:MAG: hypothetical protein RL033_4769 [Pseudomonadota bacterium]|jgi:hypothetical protein
MSMILTVRRLGDPDLLRLREHPELVADYLGEDPPDGFGPFADIDVDKAWHAIHFLLTHTAWEGAPPLNFVVTGGTEVGDALGYGPARGFTSAEVRLVADALEALTPDVLLQRFDPAALTAAEIYPQTWDRPPEEDDTRGYVADYFDQLRSFVIDAAAAGEAMLISLT